jgi:hypothetical protein
VSLLDKNNSGSQQMVQTKTYFVTDQLVNKFPIEFTSSKNRKYIVVQHCRCIYNEYLTGDIQVHADFIQRNHYLDYFACFTNTIMTKYKKFEFIGSQPGFTIWFTNMSGEDMTDRVSNFVLELLLIY